MKSRYILAVFFVAVPLVNLAQSSSELGLLPLFNINKKLPRDWSVNFKIESRQSLVKGDFNYDYLLTDLSPLIAKKIGINATVTVGYLMRIDDESIKNRAIQQITFVKRYSNFNLAHRVSTDQTFQKDDDTEFRFRYRLSTEIPLRGQSLDPKEFFLKLSNEYLNSLQGKDYDLEIRVGTFLGHAFSPANKLEFGLDYRVDSFINANPRNRFWIGLSFYQSI